jgi:hypothetical protein
MEMLPNEFDGFCHFSERITGLHPLQPGAMRGDGATGLKKQFPRSLSDLRF